MNTQLNVEAQIDVLQDSKKVIDRVIAPAHGRENRNSVEQNVDLQARLTEGKSAEGGKEASRRFSVASSTHVASSLSSYKAQKLAFSDLKEIWSVAKAELQKILTLPTYETWISPCLLISVKNGQALLAVPNDFHCEMIVKRRLLPDISRCLSALLDEPIGVKIAVEPGLFPEEEATPTDHAPKQAENNPQRLYIKHHNPYDDPGIAYLLDKYRQPDGKVNVRCVLKFAPMFEKPLAKYEDGGWNIGFGAMMNACKDHGLAKVVWAIRAVKRDRAADDFGKLFYLALRKGLEDAKYGY